MSTGSQTRIRLRTATPSSSSSTETCTWQPQVSISRAVEAERVVHAGVALPRRSAIGSTATGEVASAATRAPTAAAAASARRRQCRSSASTSSRVAQTRGAEFDLLRLQLGHQVGAGLRRRRPPSARRAPRRLPLAAPGGDLQRLGTQRHRPAGGVDDQQFFLDPDGAHPPMIASPAQCRRMDRRGPPPGCRIDRPLSPTIDTASRGTSGPAAPPGHHPTPPPDPAIAAMPPGGRRGRLRQVTTKIDAHFCWG